MSLREQDVRHPLLDGGLVDHVVKDQDAFFVSGAQDSALMVNQEEALKEKSMDQLRLHTRFPF